MFLVYGRTSPTDILRFLELNEDVAKFDRHIVDFMIYHKHVIDSLLVTQNLDFVMTDPGISSKNVCMFSEVFDNGAEISYNLAHHIRHACLMELPDNRGITMSIYKNADVDAAHRDLETLCKSFIGVDELFEMSGRNIIEDLIVFSFVDITDDLHTLENAPQSNNIFGDTDEWNTPGHGYRPLGFKNVDVPSAPQIGNAPMLTRITDLYGGLSDMAVLNSPGVQTRYYLMLRIWNSNQWYYGMFISPENALYIISIEFGNAKFSRIEDNDMPFSEGGNILSSGFRIQILLSDSKMLRQNMLSRSSTSAMGISKYIAINMAANKLDILTDVAENREYKDTILRARTTHYQKSDYHIVQGIDVNEWRVDNINRGLEHTFIPANLHQFMCTKIDPVKIFRIMYNIYALNYGRMCGYTSNSNSEPKKSAFAFLDAINTIFMHNIGKSTKQQMDIAAQDISKYLKGMLGTHTLVETIYANGIMIPFVAKDIVKHSLKHRIILLKEMIIIAPYLEMILLLSTLNYQALHQTSQDTHVSVYEFLIVSRNILQED